MEDLPRREREKLRRSTEIVDAAEKRFIRNGFDGVSMDDIAGDLELSKPALYRYFRNKESLYLAVVLRGMAILRDTFKNAVSKEKTGIAKVSSFLKALCYEYVHDHPAYYRLTIVAREQRFMEMFSRHEIDGAEKFGNMALESLMFLVDAIKLGVEDGTIRKDIEPLQTAIFLVAASEAAINMTPEYQNLLKREYVNKDDYLGHSIELMAKGIASEPL